jgi:hypothetical protein
MLEFSTSPPRIKTLRAPLTKLSRDNIYSHCAHNYQTPLRCANIAHTTHAIIINVHTLQTYYAYSHCAKPNLARAPAHQHFSVRRQNLVRAPENHYFFARYQNLACAPACQYLAA